MQLCLARQNLLAKHIALHIIGWGSVSTLSLPILSFHSWWLPYSVNFPNDHKYSKATGVDLGRSVLLGPPDVPSGLQSGSNYKSEWERAGRSWDSNWEEGGSKTTGYLSLSSSFSIYPGMQPTNWPPGENNEVLCINILKGKTTPKIIWLRIKAQSWDTHSQLGPRLLRVQLVRARHLKLNTRWCSSFLGFC